MMSQYEYQQSLKKQGIPVAGAGTRKSVTSLSNRNNGSERKRYYIKGIGWVENEPLVTTDENGERVVQTSGLQREGRVTSDGGLFQGAGDRLAKAYDNAKESLRYTLGKWHDSKKTASTADDETSMRKLYEAYKKDGRYNGTYEDFAHWLNVYMAQMSDETLNVSALANTKGVATANANGTPKDTGGNGTRVINGQTMKFNGFGYMPV